MAESGPGDGRSIENPTEVSDMPDELEEAVRGEEGDDVGSSDERVSEPGEGLTTEEGVNER